MKDESKTVARGDSGDATTNGRERLGRWLGLQAALAAADAASGKALAWRLDEHGEAAELRCWLEEDPSQRILLTQRGSEPDLEIQSEDDLMAITVPPSPLPCSHAGIRAAELLSERQQGVCADSRRMKAWGATGILG